VLGGTGHLGSALVHQLIQKYAVSPKNIRIFYLPNSPTNSLHDIQELDMFPGNILNLKDIETATNNIDYVFHMIGNTTFDPLQKALQWRINVEGTRNVLEVLKNSQSIKRMCYTSTVNTLGVPHPLGSIGTIETCDSYLSIPRIHSFENADQTLHFIDRVRNNKSLHWVKEIGVGYFDSKLAAQELINSYVKQFGLDIVSVLPGTMFGPYDYLIGNGMYLISLSRNQMPGVLPGGMPLAHVFDVVEGHLLTMRRAQKGSRYIISGRIEDNKYLKDMVKEIVSVLVEKNPEKTYKIPSRVFKKGIAMIGAWFSELYAKWFHKPCLLSRSAVIAGSLALFYSSEKAIADLGYSPQYTFRTAVEDMYNYYSNNELMNAKGRFIDQKK
jgi:nucleoside-diphosphate-sugar epimerase